MLTFVYYNIEGTEKVARLLLRDAIVEVLTGRRSIDW